MHRGARTAKRLWVLLLPAVLLPSITRAQATWTYDHLRDCPAAQAGQRRPPGCTRQTTLEVSPGDHFTIVIANTYAAGFTYEIQGYATNETEQRPSRGPLLGVQAIDTVSLDVTHDRRYGGYVVSITPKVDPTGIPVGAATLVIAVPAQRPPYAFSGGISLTSIRNPGFVVRKEYDTTLTGTTVVRIDTLNRIRRDSTRRDDATVAFATFATVNFPRLLHHVDLSRVNLAVGIGIESGGQTQYYFGLGVELHTGVFLNAGYVLGRVDALPSGLQVGDRVDDPNALANLSHRSQSGLFVGLSFTFLGGGKDTFGKPFAGSRE